MRVKQGRTGSEVVVNSSFVDHPFFLELCAHELHFLFFNMFSLWNCEEGDGLHDKNAKSLMTQSVRVEVSFKH